jgi:DHA1 family tetracycline resistance protein-like MFS transporter
VIVLFLIVFIGLVGFGIILPLFPFYAERFGASPEVITWTMSGFTLGQFVATPLWGRLSDATGRRRVLILTMLGQAIGYVVLAYADTLALVIASRVWGGLMAGNISAAFAYVSDITTPDKRAAGLGKVGAALGLGFTFGPVIGGLLAGAEVRTADYESPALAAAVLSTVAMLGAMFFLPESLAKEHRKPLFHRGQAARSAVGTSATRAALWNLLLVGFVFYIAMSLMESIFPLWANDRFTMGPRDIGIVFFVLGILQAVIQGALMGRLTKTFGERSVAIASGFFFGGGLAVLAAAGSLWQIALGIVLFGIGVGMFNPTVSSMVSQTAAANQRGAVMGMYQAAGALGRVVGPGVSGLMYSKIGLAAPFALGAGIMLPVIGLLTLVRLASHDTSSDVANEH